MSSGRHRKPTSSAKSVAKVAFTGAVIGSGGLALAGHAGAATDGEWDKVAACESGGNWAHQHRQRIPGRAAVLAGHLEVARRRRVRAVRAPGHQGRADRGRRARAGHPGPRRVAGLRQGPVQRHPAQRGRRAQARCRQRSRRRRPERRTAPPPPPFDPFAPRRRKRRSTRWRPRCRSAASACSRAPAAPGP